jgi:hypothetical protein
MGSGAQPQYPGTAVLYPQAFAAPVQSAATDTSSLLSGRLSLALLEGIVLGLVGFYIWTHKIQGGG